MTIKWQQQLAVRLTDRFESYEETEGSLPGLTTLRRDCLVQQLVDSSRSRWYVQYLLSRELSARAADPADAWFNPVKAAIIRSREGDDDESFWLIFLLTHFGKHRRAGWKYVRNVYGALGMGDPWTWRRVTSDIILFRDWLARNRKALEDSSSSHGFGNHRKYESLDGWSDAGTGSVVASYVAWVGETRRATVFGLPRLKLKQRWILRGLSTFSIARWLQFTGSAALRGSTT